MASIGHAVLPLDVLAHSPSRADGIPEEIEQTHRFWGCEIIEEAGILLRLPQVVMVTAQTMLHRFFYRKSLRDFDAFRVAIGCLFLAAKVEEQPKRIKDVLSVFYAIYRRRKWQKTILTNQLLGLESESYNLWRDWLIMVERQILIDLGFSLYNIMEHPHKYILYYIKILDGSKELAQKAWGYLNDSLRIDLCVRFHAEAIACAAIFIAARELQIKLPDEPAWYELFNVDRDTLITVVQEILKLYKREKIVWLDALTKVDPFAIDDMPDMDDVTSRLSERNDPVGAQAIVKEGNAMLSSPAQDKAANETKESKRPSRFSATTSPRSERPSSSSSRVRDRERSRDRDRSTNRERDRRSSRSRRSRSRSDDRSSRSSRRDRRHRSRSHEDDRQSHRHHSSRRSRSRSRRR